MAYRILDPHLPNAEQEFCVVVTPPSIRIKGDVEMYSGKLESSLKVGSTQKLILPEDEKNVVGRMGSLSV
jgi:hypothetical protein